jgi:hypothetical protein
MCRLVRFGFPILALSGLLSFTGCSSMGGGTPNGQAQVTIKGVLEPQIESKVEDVFFRHGFDFKGAADDHMVFERPGGTMNDVLYGNWQDKGDTTTRVTVYIIPKGDMTYALRARSIAVRHTFGADSDTELFDVQGARYKAILDKVAKELKQEYPTTPAR